jgi:hypothetical protein
MSLALFEYSYCPCFRSGNSSVGTATSWGLDDREVGCRVLVGSRIFSSLRRLDRLWGSTQPPIQGVPGALSLGVKRQGSEADHSLPASAEVKKMWIYTSTPPYAFMAQCLISYAQEQIYLFTVRVLDLSVLNSILSRSTKWGKDCRVHLG